MLHHKYVPYSGLCVTDNVVQTWISFIPKGKLLNAHDTMEVSCVENYITSLPENNNQELPLVSALTNSEFSIYPLLEKDPWFGSVSFCSWSNCSYDSYWGGRHSNAFCLSEQEQPIINKPQHTTTWGSDYTTLKRVWQGSQRTLIRRGMPEPRKVSKKGSKKTAPKAFKSSKRKRRSRKELLRLRVELLHPLWHWHLLYGLVVMKLFISDIF